MLSNVYEWLFRRANENDRAQNEMILNHENIGVEESKYPQPQIHNNRSGHQSLFSSKNKPIGNEAVLNDFSNILEQPVDQSHPFIGLIWK
jgi:hypothetical protein